MADEVQLFYSELITLSGLLNDASTGLLASEAQMSGDDVGVGNPARRASLRLAMHSAFTQLGSSLASGSNGTLDLSSLLSSIANGNMDLDAELSGGN
ncbi:MAG: hypothetical protein LBU78_01675 [Microbacterium sp.]|nr:hypothetical protein [Microbacterium sp.]